MSHFICTEFQVLCIGLGQFRTMCEVNFMTIGTRTVLLFITKSSSDILLFQNQYVTIFQLGTPFR